MLSLSNNGHVPVAPVAPNKEEAAHAGTQAAQWNHGLQMEALANLAHELRSPMQAILGYIDILRDELGEEIAARHKQIIERLNANAHDLAQTVENVMDFSVAAAGAETPLEQEIRPRDLAADLAPALDAANGSKRLQVRFDLENAPFVFRARLRPIKSILLNLALNAIKFTERGSVTIAIRGAWTPDFATAIELEVRDTGPGIEPAMLPYAFQPYAQLSRSSIRRHRGVGLGLAVVRRNVEALGGRIIVNTAAGQGSAFLVTIPVAAGSAAHPARAEQAAERRPQLFDSKPLHAAFGNPCPIVDRIVPTPGPATRGPGVLSGSDALIQPPRHELRGRPHRP